MLKGTCFFEGVLNEHLEERHLNFLLENHWAQLEFTVHPNLMPLQRIRPLIRQWIKHQRLVSFHTPSFVESVYGPTLDHPTPESLDKILKYLDTLLEICAVYPEPIEVVFHGAQGHLVSPSVLYDSTCRFFDKLLNRIEQTQLPVALLLENTCSLDGLTATDTLTSLNRLSTNFDTSHFGFCIDLAHLWRSQTETHPAYQLLEADNQQLLERTSYFHLHGIHKNLSKSHLTYKNSPNDYIDFVKAVSSKKADKIFSLEIFELRGVENFNTYQDELLQWF